MEPASCKPSSFQNPWTPELIIYVFICMYIYIYMYLFICWYSCSSSYSSYRNVQGHVLQLYTTVRFFDEFSFIVTMCSRTHCLEWRPRNGGWQGRPCWAAWLLLKITKIFNTLPFSFLGSYSLVGIGKFILLFLWFIGGVRYTLSSGVCI